MKTILMDADGVTLKRQAEYFSQKLGREHGAPIEEVTAFFKTTYRECQLGKLDLKQELAQLLPQWGWQGSTEEFLAYWFATDIPDQEVLAAVAQLRAQGIALCLATDQEQYRAQNITEGLGFGALFDHCFFSYQFGCSKEDPAFFIKLAQELGTTPAEMAFWDDDMKNIEAAKEAGLDAHFYTSLDEFKKTYSL